MGWSPTNQPIDPLVQLGSGQFGSICAVFAACAALPTNNPFRTKSATLKLPWYGRGRFSTPFAGLRDYGSSNAKDTYLALVVAAAESCRRMAATSLFVAEGPGH